MALIRRDEARRMIGGKLRISGEFGGGGGGVGRRSFVGGVGGYVQGVNLYLVPSMMDIYWVLVVLRK